MMQNWLAGLVGEDLAPILFVLLAALFVAGLAVVVIRLLRGLLTGGIGLRSSEGPRVEVMDVTAVDPKRKLVLVRRDQVEHLILIGGANDLVIESRIGRPAPPPPRRTAADAGFVPVPTAQAEPGRVEASNAAPRAPVQPEAPMAQPRGPVEFDRSEPVFAPPVRAPQPQPRPQAPAPVATAAPVVSAPAAKTPDESGQRVEPNFMPEPPRVRPAEPVRSPNAPAVAERSAVASRAVGASSPQQPVPAVAPAIDRAPVGPSSPVPAPRAPTTNVVVPPVTPPVEAQQSLPERRPAPAPQQRPSPEAQRPAEPVIAPAPPRAVAPEWPVRDAPESRNVDRPVGPSASAPPVSPPKASPQAAAVSAPAPASSEERPLVVRSFASTIGERRSGPVMPAAPMVASPAPSPTPKPAPAPEADDLDPDLDDDFLADLSRQLEMSDEPEARKPEPENGEDDSAPGVPARRELSLEDEMQRLLRDFSAHADRR